MNGSGKSNILDAICFAMGITTLSSVRVSNLQELIYKQGTAGITKASVTLVFDNSDKNQSPTGYEGDAEISVTRQIQVSAPCKYMINGRKALATEVSNMFRSVQLNVNNPHFLIMQGRITKVLNMKPEEIRDMLQEALGTLMYETKKLEAQKKMAQKDVKVQAINETLEKQITPRVEKLREDKKDYDRFNAVVQDMQRHKRFIIAYDFHSKQELSKDGRKELIEIADKLEVAKTNKKTANTEEKNFARDLEERRKKRDQEASKPFKQAEEAEKQASQSLVRVSATKDAAADDLKQEKKTLSQQEARYAEVEDLSGKAVGELKEAQASVEQHEQQVEKSRAAWEKARLGVESAETGNSDRVQEELMEVQKTEQELNTKIKMSDMTTKTKSEERKKVEKEYNQAVKEEEKSSQVPLDGLKAKVEEVRKRLEALPVSSSTGAGESLSSLRERVKQLRSIAAPFVAFKYDETALSKQGGECFGRLASLVRLDETKAETHARAMEVVAGSKLYQVVVDSKETGKALLKNGKLAQRVTLVPLDSVSPHMAEEHKVSKAVKKAKKEGGWCCLAIDCLSKKEISPKVWPAMQYAFGQTLICDSAATAKAIAFDDDLRLKCVTLDGDLFDPSGTLTGGSRGGASSSSGGNPPLFDLFHMYRLEMQIETRVQEEKSNQHVENERVELTRELGRRQHELDMAMARNAEAKSFRLNERLQVLGGEIQQAEKDRDEAKQALKACSARIAELKDSLKNAQASKQKLIADAKKAETQAKKTLKDAENAHLAALKRVEEVESARKRYAEELVSLVSTMEKQKSLIATSQTQFQKLDEEYAAASEAYRRARADREEKERALASWDSSFVELENAVNKANERARELDNELKRLDARQQKLKVEIKAAEDSMTVTKREHLWIDKEMQFFGKPHTEYDFEVKDPAEISQKYKELEEVQAQLSRSINKKALAMMEKAEEEYDSLDRKRRTIESDRLAIERVISGLDRKKNEALVAAYEKVNKDFGSIFSTLLPGARAELRPVEGGTVLDGLEVRVAFGQTWKESLAELSGGQRSLLALSLVLALLRFKPAPLCTFCIS